MTEIKTAVTDAVLDDPRRALRRCDDEGIGMRGAAPINVAIHFLDANKMDCATMDRLRFAESAQNLLVVAAVAVIALSAGSLFWFA